ncbi:MAG: DUF1326 domain-containing protein [Nitrososphaeraceae archaeon]
MATVNIPKWKLSGDWFDVCKCNIPCLCIFAQNPTYGDCDGVLAYHINTCNYGNIILNVLNVMALSSFEGNIWAGNTKASIAISFDGRADQHQRETLKMIFSGNAGGFMAQFAKLIGDHREINFATIRFEAAKDLSYWKAEIPGKVIAKAEALTGPMTPAGKRVETINAPGSEVGPDRSISDQVNASEIGYKWERSGRSSKHIKFDWSGPQFY